MLLPLAFCSQLTIKDPVKKELIGNVITSGINWFECNKYEEAGDYLFTFRNWKYKKIFKYESFNITGDKSFIELYNLIILTLKKKEEKEIKIELNKTETLTLIFKGKTMEFWVWNGAYNSYSCPMNIKGINWLFGKSQK